MSNFFFLTSGSYRWTQSTVAKSLNDFLSSARYCLQPAVYAVLTATFVQPHLAGARAGATRALRVIPGGGLIYSA
ncbi:hypothetical protein HBI92_038770 [Parastagonospora nodorum]|nr:hypothetical protein HBI92_038770 [Parastagonospora nodorum]